MFKAEKLLQKVKDDYNRIAEHFGQTRQYPWPEFADFKPYFKSGQRVLDVGCGNGRLYFSFLKNLNLQYHGIDISERLVEIANRVSRLPAHFAMRAGKAGIVNRESRPPRFAERGRGITIHETFDPCFTVGDITKLNFQDNYFDVVLCIATFHHLPTKELRLKALNEIKRVLKPGGYLLMTNWYWWQKFPWKYFFHKLFWKNSWNDLFIPWKNQKREVVTDLYYHAFTKNELRNLMGDSGLMMEKIYLFDKEKKPKKKSRTNLIIIAKK